MLKFYRFLLISIVCFCAFVAGWLARDAYQELSSGRSAPILFTTQTPDQQCADLFQEESWRASRFRVGKKEVNPKADQDILNKNSSLSQKQDGASSNLNQVAAPILGQATDSNLKQIAKPVQKEVKKTEEQIKREKEIEKINRQGLGLRKSKWFNTKGEYSYLVNVFSDKEKALQYLNSMRKKYPLWILFLNQGTQGFKVYVGPFKSKKEAEAFMDSVPIPMPFPNYFLENRSL